MSRRTTVILLTLLVSASLIIIFWKSHRAHLTFQPTNGSRLIYAIDYKSRTDASGAAADSILNSLAQTTQVAAQGRLALTVLEKVGDRMRLAGELQLDTLTGMPVTTLKHVDFSLFITRRGEIQDLRFPADQFAEGSILVIDILKRFDQKFPIASIQKDETWEQDEHQMQEKIRQSNRLIALGKEEARFEKKFYNSSMILSGSGQYVWDLKARTLRSANIERVTEQKDIQGVAITNNLSISIAMESMSLTAVADLIKAAESYKVAENLQQDHLKKTMEDAEDRKILGDRTPEDILAQLDNASAEALGPNMDVFMKLEALFRLHPEAIALFQDRLQSLDRSDYRFRVLAMALTSVGSPEAQAAIIEALNHSDDERKRMTLIPQLSFMKHTEQASEDYLRQLAASDASENVQKTAELGLGTIAHNLRTTAPERSVRILQDSAESLSRSTGVHEIRHQLSVIGNIGLPAQKSLVEPYLVHEDPKIRASAVSSLRFIGDEDSTQVMVNALSSDPSDFVRENASEGLTYLPRETEAILRVRQQLASEKNIQIIKNLIRVLAKDAVTNPSSREFLEQYNQSCAHPDLCTFVAGVVSSLSSMGG